MTDNREDRAVVGTLNSAKPTLLLLGTDDMTFPNTKHSFSQLEALRRLYRATFSTYRLKPGLKKFDVCCLHLSYPIVAHSRKPTRLNIISIT